MWSKHFSLLSLRSLRKDLVLRALKKSVGFHCGEYFIIVLITKLSGATSSQMVSITGHVLVCLFWLGTRKCYKAHILKIGPLTIVTVLVWKAERWNIFGVSTCFILLPCTHSPSKKKNKCKVAAVTESSGKNTESLEIRHWAPLFLVVWLWGTYARLFFALFRVREDRFLCIRVFCLFLGDFWPDCAVGKCRPPAHLCYWESWSANLYEHLAIRLVFFFNSAFFMS